MRSFHLRRLAKLAALLRSVPPKQFDIWVWSEEKDECGFVACAAGWAGTIPEFKRAGLRVNICGPKYVTKTRLYTSWEALSAFFGLTLPQAERIFSSWGFIKNRITAKDVAKKINQLLKKEGVTV